MTKRRAVIVGSGPAAAGVALALLEHGTHDIVVLDLGHTLEPERQDALVRLGASPAAAWQSADVETISLQPVGADRREIPQKRAYGSDFPFRDLGQLSGLEFLGGANSSPISAAYGGFSNVWGAQTMPFSRATFDTWPFSFDELAPHYSAALDEVPLAAEPDDYEAAFPLLTTRARPLPTLSHRSQRVLDAYERNRARVNEHGVTVGRARLALRADDCVRCGLCMTGCPYGLIYSASQTFDRLRREGSITYRGGQLVRQVGEDEAGSFVVAGDLATGRIETVRADDVFVAAGGIGSTRVIVNSLPEPPTSLSMSESVQFAIPFLSAGSAGDPRHEDTFTLNQFNILVSFDEQDYHTSQVHCYPYNPAMLGALPGLLGTSALSALTGQLLGRLTIGLGYLPSWASPRVQLAVSRASGSTLPTLTVGIPDDEPPPLMLAQVLRRLQKAGRAMDLHPIAPAVRLSASAKSYHFGGSFPHRADPRPGELASDLLGRLPQWRHIHLVDGSVLPSVPSTTFTLTVMANAHRIATAVARSDRR